MQINEILKESINFSESKSYENITLVPISLKERVKHKSLIRSLEVKDVKILESENVNSLKIQIKNIDRPILIPFLQIVGGGKQDRMLTRPIIISEQDKGKIITIPVNCIEQGRWQYSRSSTGEKTSEDFKTHKMVRMSPSLGSLNMLSRQTATWNSVNYFKNKHNLRSMKYASSSYMEMSEDLSTDSTLGNEKKTKIKKETLEHLKKSNRLIDNQCGLAFFIDNELIGLEIFGSKELWEDQSEGVINSYMTEIGIRDSKNEKTDLIKIKKSFLHQLENIKLEKNTDEVIGAGTLYQTKFDIKNPALLLEDNENIVEFYYAKIFDEAERESQDHRSQRANFEQRQQEIRNSESYRRQIYSELEMDSRNYNPDHLLLDLELKKLTIVNANLRELPIEVKELIKLVNLDLRGNKLKTMPEFVENMELLEYLLLDNNVIESLPSNFKNLKSLRRLYLMNNNIKSIKDIKSVFSLPELTVLDLRGNTKLGKYSVLYSGKHEIKEMLNKIQ